MVVPPWERFEGRHEGERASRQAGQGSGGGVGVAIWLSVGLFASPPALESHASLSTVCAAKDGVDDANLNKH